MPYRATAGSHRRISAVKIHPIQCSENKRVAEDWRPAGGLVHFDQARQPLEWEWQVTPRATGVEDTPCEQESTGCCQTCSSRARCTIYQF